MDVEEFAEGIDHIINEIKNKNNETFISFSEIVRDPTFEEVLDEINLDTYSTYEEVDYWSDADSEPKYIYRYYILEYQDRHIEICIQTGGHEEIQLMSKKEVRKQEIVSYSWDTVK